MIEERIKRAAEQLLDDSSLTDELDDQEARHLIEWGLAVSRRLCQQTTDLADAQAEAFLESALITLRRVIRRTNKLVGALSYADPEEIAESLHSLFETARQLPLPIHTPTADLGQEAAVLLDLPPGDALSKVLVYLTPEDTDDQKEQ